MLALWTLLSTVASTTAASPPESAVAPGQSPLDEALSSYLDGDLPAARDALARIVNDPDADDEDLLDEARVWLGEVQYYLGEKDAARSTFRAVLLYDRGYRMDPFVHPPEVVAFFDSVRAEVEASGLGPRTLPSTGPPLHAFLWPGGLQLHNGRAGAAALTALTVTGSAAMVGGMRIYLVNQDQNPNSPGIDVPAGDVERLEAIRAAQFGVAAVGTTLWLGTTVGGSVRAVQPTVYPGGLGLSIHW